MTTALIGHSGFVGSNLAQQMPFDAFFNTKNIQEIRGKRFGHIVCAGVYAEKWRANAEPVADFVGIRGLMDNLEEVRAGHFTLISTVDVYGDPCGVTEDDVPNSLQPYGLHRFIMEGFVKDRFPSHTIVRLPALFGRGLKKNVLFDMMHGNALDRVVPNSWYQWYPVRHLAEDLKTFWHRGMRLVNVTSRPIQTSEIRDRLFPRLSGIGDYAYQPPIYDVRSIHALSGYWVDVDDVWRELELFVKNGR